MMTKTVLITGASSGIGRATAERFARDGWNVAATMRTPSPSDNPNIVTPRLDVTDLESIAAAVDETLAKFGQIDVLVNNAGYGTFGPLEAFTTEQIRHQFATNVDGLLAITRAVLPHMRARRTGAIVNISSVGGVLTLPMFSLYHGTKWAVEGISESLTYELGPLGIRVKLVQPGAIDTDFGGRSFVPAAGPIPTEYEQIFQTVLSRRDYDRSPASLVADVIYEAATDPSDTLRYPAGPDAHELIAYRAEHGDLATLAAARERFGLPSTS